MPFLISASVNSGRTPSFEASGECTLVDHGNGTATVSLTETVGECSITARCGAEPGLYAAAPDVTQTFQVLKRDQTITFAALASKASTDPPFVISATATSDLPVAFAATGDCSLVDHGNGTATVTLSGSPGSCEITASQAGNSIYNAAIDVVRDFVVRNPDDFPLDDLCHITLPCSLPEVMSMVGTELHIKKTGATDAGFRAIFGCDAQALASSGTLEFRFGPQLLGCGVGLSTKTLDGHLNSCREFSVHADILSFGIDFEFQTVPSPDGNQNCLIIGTDRFSESAVTNVADIWKIVVDGTDVKIYRNGMLEGTGTKDARDLHIDTNFYTQNSEVYIRQFSLGIY